MLQRKPQGLSTATNIITSTPLEDGLHLTHNQRMVFMQLSDLGRSAGAYELLDMLRPQGVNAIPTIYRALKGLETKGLVKHLRSTKSFFVPQFSPQNNNETLMLVCEQCQKVSQHADNGMLAVLRERAKSSGFLVHLEILELVGICSTCKEQEPLT